MGQRKKIILGAVLLGLVGSNQALAYMEYEDDYSVSSPDTQNYRTNRYAGNYNNVYRVYYDDHGHIIPRKKMRSQRRVARQYEQVERQNYKTNFSGHRSFVFNPRTLTWTAYAGGEVVGSGRAVGGRGYCPDVRRRCHTPVGNFRVYSEGNASCKSSKYPVGRGGAPMPYCMFFRGGYSIHGSNDVPNYNASHGCIRVLPAAAQWLNRNFMQVGTAVKVLPY